ncbi:MAG: hypothetical protein WC284_16600 [Candidimonas sp.]
MAVDKLKIQTRDDLLQYLKTYGALYAQNVKPGNKFGEVIKIEKYEDGYLNCYHFLSQRRSRRRIHNGHVFHYDYYVDEPKLMAMDFIENQIYVGDFVYGKEVCYTIFGLVEKLISYNCVLVEIIKSKIDFEYLIRGEMKSIAMRSENLVKIDNDELLLKYMKWKR